MEALSANRKIPLLFKDAQVSHGVLGGVIGDLSDRFPEKLIEETLKLEDMEWY
jgi:hypothetical protein